MIPLSLAATSDADAPFVTRLAARPVDPEWDSQALGSTGHTSLWCGPNGLFELGLAANDLLGDIVRVDPEARRADRLIRAGSRHNTLLVTERCDQLCVMCSQPPKKTHVDRFEHFERACLLAPQGQLIGISGGEPTLYLDPLLSLVERVLQERPDLSFHILTNGQHFSRDHGARLQSPLYRRVAWGIPLYAAEPERHDQLVGKPGAFERLMTSLGHLLLAAARIELRTVLMSPALPGLDRLARLVVRDLPHIEQWSLMGLENIGFARRRWAELSVDYRAAFEPIGKAISLACLHGVPARLFNIPLCLVPAEYRAFAVDSISDWKKRFAPQCSRCAAQPTCPGFFEWHPTSLLEEAQPL